MKRPRLIMTNDPPDADALAGTIAAKAATAAPDVDPSDLAVLALAAALHAYAHTVGLAAVALSDPAAIDPATRSRLAEELRDLAAGLDLLGPENPRQGLAPDAEPARVRP